jgi:hypothetical protein
MELPNGRKQLADCIQCFHELEDRLGRVLSEVLKAPGALNKLGKRGGQGIDWEPRDCLKVPANTLKKEASSEITLFRCHNWLK